MTQELFTTQINSLSNEVSQLEQLLTSKRQQVEALQKSQSLLIT